MPITPRFSEDELLEIIRDNVPDGTSLRSLSRDLGYAPGWLRDRIDGSQILSNTYIILRLRYKQSVRRPQNRVLFDENHDKYSLSSAMKLVGRWDEATLDDVGSIEVKDDTDIDTAITSILVELKG